MDGQAHVAPGCQGGCGVAGELKHAHAGYAIVGKEQLTPLNGGWLSVYKKGERSLRADALEAAQSGMIAAKLNQRGEKRRDAVTQALRKARTRSHPFPCRGLRCPPMATKMRVAENTPADVRTFHPP